MKTIRLITMVPVFLLLFTVVIQAQTTQQPLNQLEMFKQFIGTWKAESGKDTILIGGFSPFGNAIEGNFKSSTNDKILYSVKQLLGYDKKTDKIIMAELQESASIGIYASWFTSKNTNITVPFKDISNPENAALQWKLEIKSPDLFIQTMTNNNKVVRVLTYTRVK